LGTQTLPFEFRPYLLSPPLKVWGSYTVDLIKPVLTSKLKTTFIVPNNCPNILNVLPPTKSPTQTKTPTKTPTPTPTITPSITPSSFICPVTPTKSMTPTPTPHHKAYLFIEPFTGSSVIGQWMNTNGSNFYGFTNLSAPSQNQTLFNLDLNTYVDFTGWTNGTFPSIITQTVPQTSGGFDSFGNPIVAYNFLTTEVFENTIQGNAWYTWIIPVLLTNYERQVDIDFNKEGDSGDLVTIHTEETINTLTFTYSGSTIPATVYRVYTTFPNGIFELTNNQSIYFRGNSIAP